MLSKIRRSAARGDRERGASWVEMMKTAPLTPTASRATTAEKKLAHGGGGGGAARAPGRRRARGGVRWLTAGRAICGGCLAKGLTGRQASRSCDSKKVRARFSTLHQLA